MRKNYIYISMFQLFQIYWSSDDTQYETTDEISRVLLLAREFLPLEMLP